MPISKIFVGYRALGFVSNSVPSVIRYVPNRHEYVVSTCIGKSFHTYNCKSLRLFSISKSHPQEISCMAGGDAGLYTAAGCEIYAWKRSSEVVHTYKGHTERVRIILAFGDHLISVDEGNNLKIWVMRSEELYSEMRFEEGFDVTVVMHPLTYMNKILFGSKQGQLQLWNVKNMSLVYSFEGWDSPVLAIEQAPAVDVVAIGLESGKIIIHNLKYDQVILQFMQDWGPVVSLSFRSDGPPVLASGSTLGHIALWDLEEKKLLAQMRDVHRGAVTGMQYLPKQPMMITSSADNSLKMWVFDQPDGAGRLLRLREGHSAPPWKIRFHGNSGQNILSAGQDSTLRSFSLVNDALNKSLGQASYRRKKAKKTGVRHDKQKMPPIVDFTSETTREKEWDDIVACHRGIVQATTWSFHVGKMGEKRLLHKRFHKRVTKLKNSVAQCLCLSVCGNFVVIGYNTGHMDKFNVQSGLYRGSFGHPKAHENGVCGVVSDGINLSAISGGIDKILKFWDYKTLKLTHELKLNCVVSQLVLHRESDLLAVALDSYDIVIVDIDTKKIVRKFSGHSSKINDLCFSPDSRWLITASMDCTIRTWDIPSSHLIDCFMVEVPCTSLTMSPTCEFLATTHVDDLGVFLWSNKTVYSLVYLSPLPVDYEPLEAQLPSVNADTKDVDDNDNDEDAAVEDDDGQMHISEVEPNEQLSEELITFSTLPGSRWQNLLHLDIIKKRNKPKDPPKAPKAAPFFLPTVPGLDFRFADPQEASTSDTSHIKTFGTLPSSTIFAQMLEKSNTPEQYMEAMQKLESYGPSAIEMEIISLSTEGGGSVLIMQKFIHMISSVLESNRHFEVANAYLGLFMKLHGSTISSEPEFLCMLPELQRCQEESWLRLESLFSKSLCLVSYFKNATL